MRTLIFGMQSSGATLYAYYLSQEPQTVGILDLNNHRVAPRISTDKDTVLKCVVTQSWDLEDHVEPFQPDLRILFLRNPFDNWNSLRGKPYANRSGSLEEKFRKLDRYFSDSKEFDQVVRYEEFVANYRGEKLWRSLDSIRSFNHQHVEWCRNNPAAPGPKGGWGMGNLRVASSPLTIEAPSRWAAPSARAKEKIRRWCPRVCEAYGL